MAKSALFAACRPSFPKMPTPTSAARIITIGGDAVQQTPDVACETVKTFVKGLLALEGRMISLISLEYVLPELRAEATGVELAA